MINLELNKEFYSKLDYDKTKINWNKNPIRMDLFLSFIKVELTRSHDHLGSSNGWTELENKQHSLIVTGGIVNGIEYLDSLKYGNRLHNSYNNFVSPFYLFEIMTKEGVSFFIDYYKDDIQKIVSGFENKISDLENSLKEIRATFVKVREEIEFITPTIK